MLAYSNRTGVWAGWPTVNDGLRMRLGAVLLAILSVAAIIFGVLNFQQRSKFNTPDDGVSWLDTSSGVQAWHVAPDSPAARSGIKPGDVVTAIGNVEVHSATQVTRRLWRLGLWTEAKYRIERSGESFETKLVTIPAEKPSSIEDYLRVVGLLYLFIGLFIFARRWAAPRAVHFYTFCLVSFILYSFHYSGKLNSFDWTIYWANALALLLQPALLLHFAFVFPERRSRSIPYLLAALYSVPALLFLLHLSVATQALDLLPSLGSRLFLDRLELVYLGIYFLLAAGIFLLGYLRAPSGVLRQQLKWVTGGTLAGILPFLAFYIVPFFLGIPQSWMKASAFSLVLIPLCYGYAVIRYRLMDVDIIFKRGLAYTFATAAIVAIYFAAVALIGELFHTAWTTGPVGPVIAIVVAAFLFQPLRDWVQARLDRFFYRDRLDYRRTLIEFGRTLTNEVRLEPLLGSVLDRISQTLLVDRLAVFLEDSANPGHFVLSRSMGLRFDERLDLSFLDPERPALHRGCLFFESARAALGESESVRRTLEQLDLNWTAISFPATTSNCSTPSPATWPSPSKTPGSINRSNRRPRRSNG